uniref:protein HEXIM1-like n=1 Tax=Myxine glutinosa TaxID=7769 RepID=UPI00358F7698
MSEKGAVMTPKRTGVAQDRRMSCEGIRRSNQSWKGHDDRHLRKGLRADFASRMEVDENKKQPESRRGFPRGLVRDLSMACEGRNKRRPGRAARQNRPRRWKPYNKLSWDEKRALEERDGVRAARLRAELLARGRPVAPYNTTQFLMAEHDGGEPDLKPPPRLPHAIGDGEQDYCWESDCSGKEDEDEDEILLSRDEDGSDGEDFLRRDFAETYARYHAESLHAMNKQDLLREYLELEKCLLRLQEENQLLRKTLDESGDVATTAAMTLRPTTTSGGVSSSAVGALSALELELETLRAENARLCLHNEVLKGPGDGHSGQTRS